MLTTNLTAEQKRCVEYPLNQQVLIVNAGPGTGKTTILKERVRYIIEKNEGQKKYVLILAFNKAISLEIRKKIMEGQNSRFLEKIQHFRRSQLSREVQQWLINRTLHSLCYWIFSEEIKDKKLQLIENKKKTEYSFWFWTTSTSNIVENYAEEEEKWKKMPLKFKIMGILWFKLKKNILRKKISPELETNLKTVWREKIEVKRVEKNLFYQEIVYEDYLSTIGPLLAMENKLDLYEKIKWFLIENENNYYWLTFSDLVASVCKLLKENEEIRKKWQKFDYILVDECQDLDDKKLDIIKSLCHPETNLTFVGDPKQSIYGFNYKFNEVKDSFKLIKNNFPNYIQKDITESFRSSQSILAVVNNFSQNFLAEWHYVNLKSSQPKGQKPKVFLATSWEEQMEWIIEKLDQLREEAIKVIIYREGRIGKKIKARLEDHNKNFFLGKEEGISEAEEISEKLKKVKRKTLEKYVNIGDLIEKELKIEVGNQDFQMLIQDFDSNLAVERKLWAKEAILTPYSIKKFLSEVEQWNIDKSPVSNFAGKIKLSTIHKTKGLEFDYVFLVEANEGVLPSKKASDAWEQFEEARVFYVGITRAKKELFLFSSDQNHVSRFISQLNPELVDVIPKNKKLIVKPEEKALSFTSDLVPEILGIRGEEKVYNLLKKTFIKFQQLTKNWEEIPDLEIDIVAKTSNHCYIIEVKNWSMESLKKRQPEIIQQQNHRQDKNKIENYFSDKKVVYIVCFPRWEIAEEFQKFYREIKQKKPMLITHYDEKMRENDCTNTNIKRIDKFILEREKL
jgi:superfamily I DNA/RNA helicase